MSTANAYLTVAGLDVDVVYKDIKNLHISVYPPVGRVRVAAPERVDEDAIRLAIIQRLPWIKKQREQLQGADRQTERRLVAILDAERVPDLVDDALRRCVYRGVANRAGAGPVDATGPP